MALSPILALALTFAIIWFLRDRKSQRTAERRRQLMEAADYLELHAKTLGQFLDHASPSQDLKNLLVRFSDVMNERESVKRLADWAATRVFDKSMDSDETAVIGQDLDKLRQQQPEAADKFAAAVITAVAGASLRWPESAALFERAFPRMILTPTRDIAIAVTATRLSRGRSFSLKPDMATA